MPPTTTTHARRKHRNLARRACRREHDLGSNESIIGVELVIDCLKSNLFFARAAKKMPLDDDNNKKNFFRLPDPCVVGIFVASRSRVLSCYLPYISLLSVFHSLEKIKLLK